MTQTGKCDTCRLRKVKCDENYPKCSQCSRKDRPCTYTYGKLSAIVVEDPNEYTSHGRSKTTPTVYPIRLLKDPTITQEEDPRLRLTMEKEAENGAGIFLAFEPAAKKKKNVVSKKCTAVRKRSNIQFLFSKSSSQASNISLKHTTPRFSSTDLACIYAHLTSISTAPESPESSLAARYIHIFSSSSLATNPFSILGSWVVSIPARMGCDPTLYLAVEFAVNAFLKYVHPTWERVRTATQSKAKALKSLNRALREEEESGKERGMVRWELVLATKLHFGAEGLMGITTCYHIIHAHGLTEMLKLGCAEGMDEQHYWDLVDNTYIDEVAEVLIAGRISTYDNPTYLTLTSPIIILSCNPPPPSFHIASMLVMHSFIQLPRLVCLVRHAIVCPQDEEIRFAAISLAEELWALDISAAISSIIKTSTSVVDTPPCSSIADIIPTSLHFDSIQAVIMLTRYWMLRNQLCGILEIMYKHFPSHFAGTLLPSMDVVREVDKNAAVKIAQSVPYAASISPGLPLVPMRLLPPVGVSIGIWYRTVKRLEAMMGTGDSELVLSFQEKLELENAKRMQTWVADQATKLHVEWEVDPVPLEMMQEVIDVMSGEEIPGWLPRRVRFEQVGEEMVMKLDYEN